MSSKLVVRSLLALFTVVSLWPTAKAQDCSPPLITANSKIYNTFSPEQEMILGDLNYQSMSGDLRFIRDQSHGRQSVDGSGPFYTLHSIAPRA